ncbi:polysaccharide deacetylase family protein [Chryseobacterium luquanense]|uniref:Polysaccharide deacetylase family protein n=1 Tax=Chryseobacterium luquanense TaxID=2983766 RepID=A0ABT3Y7Y7_9FLAO|nr:polysaccharide deacetylase family protein [Chryseobacterium luquanense]MCX8534285.1 polysaccharide deacetylase family protein [Chryseobacterium luquanense]
MLKDKIIQFFSQFENENIENSFPLNYCLPVYHCVSDENLPHLNQIINYKNVKQFEGDLDYLSKYFQFVNWDEFKDFINGNFKPKKKIAFLSFDDGLSEFYNIIVPILERKGIYAINFINPAFIDNKDLMFRSKASLIVNKIKSQPTKNSEISEIISSENHIEEILKIKYENSEKLNQIAEKLDISFDSFLQEQNPYLDLNQLKKLTNKGFGISAHSWDHPLYHNLSLNQQLETTQKTLDYLKENNLLTDSFAFPFTDFGVGKDFFEELFKNENLSCTFGSAGIKTDSFERNYQRIPMETGENAESILKKEISYYKMKRFINKNKIVRK